MKQFCLGVAVAIGLTLPAFGVWEFVSCNGTDDYCVGDLNGIAFFHASGRSSMIITARNRPKFTTSFTSRHALPAEEYKAAAVGLVANFGTWSVNDVYHPTAEK
jgi:hypothetical protein